MSAVKECGCKGIRKCLLCEEAPESVDGEESLLYTYCPCCTLCWSDNSSNNLPLYLGRVKLYEDFLSVAEEAHIIKSMERIPWIPSQSGRRKQDFGPQVNFKKKKVKMTSFKGFPQFSEDIIKKFEPVPELSDFCPVELCNLEYCPERGSAIDPHMDDTWIWGERLVTVNLLSTTVLTLTPANIEKCSCSSELKDQFVSNQGNFCNALKISKGSISQDAQVIGDDNVIYQHNKRSCEHIATLETLVQKKINGLYTFQPETLCNVFRTDMNLLKATIQINLPPRSLLVFAGCARHNWYHAIQRQDVKSRRLAMTFRELSKEFCEGGPEADLGKELLKIANIFSDFSKFTI